MFTRRSSVNDFRLFTIRSRSLLKYIIAILLLVGWITILVFLILSYTLKAPQNLPHPYHQKDFKGSLTTTAFVIYKKSIWIRVPITERSRYRFKRNNKTTGYKYEYGDNSNLNKFSFVHIYLLCKKVFI